MKGRGEKKTSPTSAIGDTGGPKKLGPYHGKMRPSAARFRSSPSAPRRVGLKRFAISSTRKIPRAEWPS